MRWFRKLHRHVFQRYSHVTDFLTGATYWRTVCTCGAWARETVVHAA